MTYNKQGFLMWLEDAKHILPPMYSIEDAEHLYKLKLAQEQHINARPSNCRGEVRPMGKLSLAEKEEIYAKRILPMYGNDPRRVPPHLEPDYNEGWK